MCHFPIPHKNFSDYEGSSNSNVWYSAQFMAPIYPVYIKGEDGKDVLDADGNRQLDYGDGSVQRPQYSDFNPVGGLVDDKADIKTDVAGCAHFWHSAQIRKMPDGLKVLS